MTKDELAAYERWKREKERSDWWTENWYRMPVAMRVARIVGLLIVLAIGAGVVYGIYNVLTSDNGTPTGFPDTNPPPTVTITTEPPPSPPPPTTDTETTTETTETTETEPSEGDPAAGKEVFLGSSGCGTCHTLADAGTSGTVGPNLDDAQPSFDLVVDRVTNGQGAMPSFSSTLTEQQILDVSAYVSSVAATSGS
jgi:cytochrome c6